MRKIISLFQRDYEGDRLVRDEVVPGAEWVLAGEGQATVKWDGTACMVRDGKPYKRYDAKKGKTPPTGFEPAQEPDIVTGHWPGWLPIGDGPEDRWLRAAFEDAVDNQTHQQWENGTYEAIGPKIQGNPYGLSGHTLWKHGDTILDAPRTFDELRVWLAAHSDVEGIVWHHPDGRMVKIKRKDFGCSWPEKVSITTV